MTALGTSTSPTKKKLVIRFYSPSSDVQGFLCIFTLLTFSEKVSIVIFLSMAQHSSDIRVYDQNREERKDSTLYHNMSGRLVNLIQNYKHLSRFEILESSEEYFSSFVLCTGVKFYAFCHILECFFSQSNVKK